MSKVIKKFLFASILMCMLPMAVLFGFIYKIFPGSGQLSSYHHTLLSGCLAVLTVNLVITWYILMALKEPTVSEHQPDPKFLAEAKASIQKLSSEASAGPSEIREKDE